MISTDEPKDEKWCNSLKANVCLSTSMSTVNLPYLQHSNLHTIHSTHTSKLGMFIKIIFPLDKNTITLHTRYIDFVHPFVTLRRQVPDKCNIANIHTYIFSIKSRYIHFRL